NYPELGYNPDLNNFDHHYGCAGNSATFLFNQKYNVLPKDIVSYIDAADLGKKRNEEKMNLNVAIMGIRIMCDSDSKVVDEGCKVLEYLEKTYHKPSSLPERLPDWLQIYTQVGMNEVQKVEKELGGIRLFVTGKGRQAGYMESSSKNFSRVGEMLFTTHPELEVAVVHNPAKKRFSIRSNIHKDSWVN
ncbi:MAG: hypothetical protein FGF48_11140, partial [Candidatus Brockarchaeota archaeon]|nr:hypothetical protein [Candidatus Brockarchaeota archaeon]